MNLRNVEEREQIITQTKIRHLKPKAPLYLPQGSRVGEVVLRMRRERQTCILICEGDRCTGIFTEWDFLHKILGKNVDLSRPVDDFMSTHLWTLTQDDTVGSAIRILDEHGYCNVPLVDEYGKCSGLLQIQTVIEFLAELYPSEVLNLPPRSDLRSESQDGA